MAKDKTADDTFTWTPTRIARLATFVLALPLCMCGVAGRWRWWQSWFVLLAQLVMLAAASVFIRRTNRGLYRERERFTRNPGTAAFDLLLAPLIVWLTLALYLSAGLQHRVQPVAAAGSFADWCGRPLVQASAVVLDLAGLALFCWAICVNHFFSSVVRLQSDRGHTVCSWGPYSVVRHPGYIGAVVQGLAEAVLLQSSWAMAVSGARTVLLTVRTVAEERFLVPRLPGYAEYAAKVKARWVPWVW